MDTSYKREGNRGELIFSSSINEVLPDDDTSFITFKIPSRDFDFDVFSNRIETL